MPYHPMNHGERVTGSPHVQHSCKPSEPWDIHPESMNAEMFSLTHEIRNYNMRLGTSARFQI